jgi:hypothetical protein
MKVILLSLGILLFNIHLSHAQTKKIALRSHSGANSSFTIYVPDEFGLGSTNYNIPNIKKNKTCSLIVKPIDPKQIQMKDSMGSIQFCTPLPHLDSTSKQNSTTPKSKPRTKKKKAKKGAKKITTTTTTEIESQQVLQKGKHTKTQLAGFVPTESSESLLILLLSIPALLFFIVTIKKL